jgi:ubiquinone/menaquinone biosynthesis C-methylase UbiE
MALLYRAFSYDGKRQMSRQVIEGIADRVTLPEGGVGLDVGCGSGALTIACARRNPQAHFIGLDRWGKEYASYNKPLCEANAKAEGVGNTEFRQGDALKLDFPDESFDAVKSNYVYHNIPSRDRQKILLETLRVLKKGGTIALHDIFSKAKYGDMQAFVRLLREMGYEKVELIDTTDGMFMSPAEAKWMALSGSGLLAGRK